MLSGIILGLIVMGGSWAILHYMNVWGSEYFFNRQPVFQERTIQVIAIFMNVFPFRYFMIKADKEMTGRGLLMVTFIFGLAYFFYYLN